MSYELFSTLYCNKLPGEVMIDILSRLPIKSLIKFKSVSKSWNALINDPLFISMHVDRSAMLEDDEPLLLLLRRHDDNLSTSLYSLSNTQPFEISNISQIPYQEAFWIVGCLNGLLCIMTRNNLFKTNYFLFNPALGEFLPLPPLQSTLTEFDEIEFVSVGFGYDSRTKDYKIIRLEYLSNHHSPNAHVYTLSTDSWKQMNVTVSTYVRERICKVFVNGALHWTADRGDNQRYIVTYHVVKQIFGNVPMPNIPQIEDEIYWELHVCKGLLAIAFCYRQGDNLRFDIWVMNEYGVGQSWTRKFTVGPHSDFAVLLGITNSCELLFYNTYYFFVSVFEPMTTKTRHIDISGSFGSLEVVNYKKSIVTVKGKNYVKRDLVSWKHYNLHFLLFPLFVCLVYLFFSSIGDFMLPYGR